MDERENPSRIRFASKLSELEDKLLRMGGLVEDAIARSILALKQQDTTTALEVISGDDEIDRLELEIEDGCLTLIATQQPMARDLRRVATLFKMIVALERMADYATDIARVVLRIDQETLIKPLVDIPRMTAITQQMVKEALDSYIREDSNLAMAMAKRDDEVDRLHGQIFRELLTIMFEKPKTITQATHLLMVSRSLERISDHATNIGEEVIFLITGTKQNLNV